jgi:hypothetical protein
MLVQIHESGSGSSHYETRVSQGGDNGGDCLLLCDSMYIKRQQNNFWFQSKKQYILFYCYLDDMFRSIAHHQAIFIKLRNKVHAVQIELTF